MINKQIVAYIVIIALLLFLLFKNIDFSKEAHLS